MFKILKYSQLILENVQQAKQLLAKLGVQLTNPNYLQIRKMLSGNDGYTLWFVKQHFQNNIPMEDLKSIWDICQSDKGTIGKFKTPIVKLDTVEEFWDEYYSQKNLSKARSAYNKFLPEQRRLLDFNNQEDRNLLEELAKIEGADEYFYNKSKRYHNRANLLSAIKTFISGSSGDSDFDKLLQQLKNDNQDIRLASKPDDIIITCVDYPSIRKWGSDTSWCIVGSKGTFDSYNSDIFSQQFIIFLTDEKGIMSKIGVTTSIRGYITAHSKNDGYISKDGLIQILKGRDVDFKILLPTKDQLLSIKKWDNFAVKDLLEIGLTKEEIVSKKERYNSGSTKGDLNNFTSDEIEKWGLLDKTTLYPDDLKPFDPKEIEKKQLWKRLEINSISDLGGLKLDFKLIRKISIELCEGVLKNDFLSNLIANCRDKRTAVSKLKGTMSYTKDGRTYHEGSHDSRFRDQLRVNLFDAINPTEQEFSNEYLLDILVRKYDEKYKVEFLSNMEKEFEKRGRKLDNDLFGKLFSSYIRGNTIVSLSQAISKNLHVDWCISKIKNLIQSAEDSSTDRYRYGEKLSIFNIPSSDLKEVRNYLKDEELYNQIFNKSKLFFTTRPYELKIKHSGKYDRGTDLDATFKNIEFFDVNPTIEEFGDMLRWDDGVSKLDSIIEFLKKRNYDLSDESKLVELAKKIKNTHDSEITFYETLIKCGVAVDDSYNKLLDWVKSRTSPLSDWDKKTLEKIFNQQEIYLKKWKELHSLDDLNDALSSLMPASGEYWSKGKTTPDEWFKKHWNTIKDVSWEQLSSNRQDYEQKYFVALLVVLAKLGKVDELNGLKNERFIQGGRYDNRGLFTLLKIIADKSVINSKKSHIPLTLEERKILYNWVSKRVEGKLSKDAANYENIDSCLNICYYLFDKDKFWKSVDKALSSKNNFPVRDWNTGEIKKRSTLRVWNILSPLKFLAQDSYWSDFEKILKRLSELKMSKSEYNSTVDALNRTNFYNARSEQDREKGEVSSSREFRNESEKKLKELVSQYIKEPAGRVKKVLDWYQFSRL